MSKNQIEKTGLQTVGLKSLFDEMITKHAKVNVISIGHRFNHCHNDKVNVTLAISCAMGLETVLKFELYNLGYKDLTIENGIIWFSGTLNDQLNLWCRTAGQQLLFNFPF